MTPLSIRSCSSLFDFLLEIHPDGIHFIPYLNQIKKDDLLTLFETKWFYIKKKKNETK
jgi:hypothetical protein